MKAHKAITVALTPREMERLYLEVEKYDLQQGDRDKDFPTLSKLLTTIHLAYYGESE